MPFLRWWSDIFEGFLDVWFVSFWNIVTFVVYKLPLLIIIFTLFFSGAVRDVTQSYSLTIQMLSGTSLLSFCLWFLMPCAVSLDKRRISLMEEKERQEEVWYALHSYFAGVLSILDYICNAHCNLYKIFLSRNFFFFIIDFEIVCKFLQCQQCEKKNIPLLLNIYECKFEINMVKKNIC